MIDFGWGDLDQTYLVVAFRDIWTSDQFVTMVATLSSNIRNANQSVNCIIDLRYSGVPPMSILGAVTSAVRQRSNNLGRVIVVSQSNIWKRLYDAFIYKKQDHRMDLIFVNSMDEAYPLILAASSAS